MTASEEEEQVPPPSEYFCKKEVGGYTVYIYSLDAKIEDVETSAYLRIECEADEVV